MALIAAFGNPVYDEIITPVISSQGRVLSGCSTNACLALARLGQQTLLVGRVGPDYQAVFAADMERFGVSAAVVLDSQTGGFRLSYDQRGDRSLDLLGVAGPITHVPAQVADAAAIIVGPIMQETSLALVRDLQAQSSAPIFLDPQGLLRRVNPDGRVEHYAPVEMGAIASCCHVIKANEVEAEVLTGIHPRSDGAAAARAIRALGCQIAIVTLAELGSWIDDGQRQLLIPAYATDARDPTGAGDTYMAGFVYAYLADPEDLFTAGCTGAALASIWIEHIGPDVPITPAEVIRRRDSLLHSS